QAARAVQGYLTEDQRTLLANEIKFQTGYAKVKLPKGAIHGDLFCDNVLFVGNHLSGIIDFGFAATDFLAYDLAVTVNDWCVQPQTGVVDDGRCEALIRAYQAVRPLTPEEKGQWPTLLRAAAL